MWVKERGQTKHFGGGSSHKTLNLVGAGILKEMT